MLIPKKVINFLEKGKVKYELLKHKTVYTAYDKAATLRVKSNIVAKTLIMKVGQELLIVMVPGNRNLDKSRLQRAVNNKQRTENREQGTRLRLHLRQGYGGQGRKAKKVEFITEKVAKTKFKGVQVGSIPPFSLLWKLPVLAETTLLKNPKIIINSGSYEWSIKISSSEFKKITPELIIGKFSKERS